jgi:diaminohydroxyphosphoribosylaminopyrimidine deaminase/5-amino-6-(5-phosphoribosylamino)uracil reductase
MRRALELARRGEGKVHPNPMVGAVVVKRGRVIGEGAHARFGGPHAEVHALRQARRAAAGATLYVTLEPCAHFGKTPPCTDLILSQKIKRVVVASHDPHPLVAGRGLAKLRKAGVRVVTGVLEPEARSLNRAYFHWVRTKRPYVVVKIAQSLDGRIAAGPGGPRWITGPAARKLGHGLRAASDAVLIGVRTAIADDPRLDVRFGKKGAAPAKVVLDSRLRTPADAKLFSSKGGVLLATTRKAAAARRARYQAKAEVLTMPQKNGKVDLLALLRLLGKRGFVQVLVEGGAEVVADAFARGAVNEAYVFIAPKVLGGRGARVDVLRKLSHLKKLDIIPVGGDVLAHGVL